MKRLFTEPWVHRIILTAAFVLLITGITPQGHLYGSMTDWLSQHVALAETIRSACVEQKTLLPDFLWLGGGSNGFMFSYYGYLRPDILIGILLPGVPMVWVVTAYMLLGYLASVLLFYGLLDGELKSRPAALFGSVLFLLASCFFHTHRQVMFINYMPFLLAALRAIQAKKETHAVLFLAAAFLNSYYYAPAMLFAVFWYWYKTEGRGCMKKYLRTAALSVGMVMPLLLPTFLVILEHRRSGEGAADHLRFLPDLSFLLYSPYGMGLTVLILYLLLAGLLAKEYRKDSACYLLLVSCGVFAWLLNGTLYARGKILVPFLPLVMLHAMRVLSAMRRGDMAWQWLPFLPLLYCLYENRGTRRFVPMAVDIAILSVFFLLQYVRAERWEKIRRYPACRYFAAGFYGCLLLMPLYFYIDNAKRETFVCAKTYQAVENACAQEREDTQIPEDTLYRRDSLYEPLSMANRTAESFGRSSMYSSVTNQRYASFYHDLMLNPVQINNRIALLPGENPFLLQLMGVRCLDTTAEKVPAGYHVTEEKSGLVHAENDLVLPVAYAVSDVISQSAFDNLDAYGKLAALMEQTVVEDGAAAAKEETAFRETAERQMEVSDVKVSETLAVTELPAGGYEIYAGEDARMNLTLKEQEFDSVLLLEFEVVNEGKGAIVIDVNGMRNKLSGKSAPYPNKNTTFHYPFAVGEDGLSELKLSFSKGHYRISGIRWHVFSSGLLTEKTYIGVQPEAKTGADIFACTVTAERDGYFVTSIPKQEGMKIYIDEEEVPVLTMNTAFAGARLPEGSHVIRMTFTPPGLHAGYAAGGASGIGYLLWCVSRRIRRIRFTQRVSEVKGVSG